MIHDKYGWYYNKKKKKYILEEHNFIREKMFMSIK